MYEGLPGNPAPFRACVCLGFRVFGVFRVFRVLGFLGFLGLLGF